MTTPQTPTWQPNPADYPIRRRNNYQGEPIVDVLVLPYLGTPRMHRLVPAADFAPKLVKGQRVTFGTDAPAVQVDITVATTAPGLTLVGALLPTPDTCTLCNHRHIITVLVDVIAECRLCDCDCSRIEPPEEPIQRLACPACRTRDYVLQVREPGWWRS